MRIATYNINGIKTLEIKDMVPSEAVMPIQTGALKYYCEAGLLH
jgi:TRAP-type uncharacterized transport system substrate-binding protein